MQCVIRINDKTTHGGTVLEGSSGVKFMGLEVSCLMDKVFCPLHGETYIIEGDETSKINGKPIALHGHRCGCGCSLISSLPNAGKREFMPVDLKKSQQKNLCQLLRINSVGCLRLFCV